MPDGTETKFKLGDKVTDRVTGFSGTVQKRAEILFETPEIFIQPKGPAYRRADEGQWFKESRLMPTPPPVTRATAPQAPKKTEKVEVKS